ncbi:MAG: oligosaccharide flippase family protein [Flavobacteriales bacterium]
MSQGQDGTFSRSVQWQTLNVGVQILIQLAFVRYLGEILTESEWGLVGVVLGFAGLLEIFAQLGVGPSLIQRKGLSRPQVSAAFWFSLFQGMAFCAAVYFSAPAIADWFDKPDMEPVLRWVAFSFLIASLALVPRSLLIRRMDFRSLFWSSLIAMGLGTGVFGIWAASEGWGVYAYIGALLVQNGLLGINYWARTRLRVSLRPHVREAGALLRYGVASTAFNFLNYAATKIDLLVLDKLLPPARDAVVGLYERSVYLMNTPVTVLGKLSDSVLFSGMSGVQDEQERLRSIFYGGTYVVTTLVLPGVLLLELFMEDVVLTLVGSKLLGVVPFARILVLGILFRSWIKVCDAVVRAVDAIVSASVIKAGFCAMVGAAAWWGATDGLASLCIGMVAATTVQSVAMLLLTRQRIRFEWGMLLKLSAPGVKAAFAAGIGALPALLLFGEAHWSLHFLMGVAGMGGAVLALAWFHPASFRVGPYDLLAQIAGRVPLAALRNRWAPEENR